MAIWCKALAVSACVVLAGGLAAGLADGSAQPPEGAKPTAPSAPPAAAEGYKIDSAHSSVIFRIKHNGLANFYGRFDQISGRFAYDPASPDSAMVDATIRVGSIHTGADGRDNALSKAAYFNSEKYGTITFKGTGAKSAGGKVTITGDLTMLGVTKPVTATITDSATKGTNAGLEAVMNIKRSDFGMTEGIQNGGLGDEVQVTVAVEGGKK